MAVLSYTFEKKLLLLSIAFVFVAGKGSIFYGGRDSWFLLEGLWTDETWLYGVCWLQEKAGDKYELLYFMKTHKMTK